MNRIKYSYVDESEIHGRGLFARLDIASGTCIGTYDGPRTTENGMHVLWVWDEEDERWQGVDGDNRLRYLNHSDQPNAEFEGLDLYAIRDIEAGEEITFDYQWD